MYSDRCPGVFGIGGALPEGRAIDPERSLVELAADAARVALQDAGCDAAEVDRVIACTITPDDVTPGLAPGIAHEIGADSAGATDLSAACAGFLYGLEQASALIESGRAEVVLVCAADAMSRVDERFGEHGAAAAVVSHGELDIGCPRFVLGADGAHRASMYATIESPAWQMDGPEVQRHSIARMTEAMTDALARAGVSASELDLLVAGHDLGIAAERVDLSADPSSASIPLALWQAERDGRLLPGMTVGMAAFGPGFVWGAGVISWKERAEVYA